MELKQTVIQEKGRFTLKGEPYLCSETVREVFFPDKQLPQEIQITVVDKKPNQYYKVITFECLGYNSVFWAEAVVLEKDDICSSLYSKFEEDLVKAFNLASGELAHLYVHIK